MPPSPKIPIAPGTSRDGVTEPSQFGRKRSRQPNLASLCPHVKLGGGVCGQLPKHCLCLCMCCQAPMCARQICNARLDDDSVCTWGQPGASPEPMATPIKMMGRMLFGNVSIGIRNLCLPNLEPGGPSYVGGVSLDVTPKRRRERTPNKSTFRSPSLIPDFTPSPTPAVSPAKLAPPMPRSSRPP